MSEQSVKSLPLHDKRILVTRTREQAHVLSERLRALGATPVEFPTIHIVPPQNWAQLDSALDKLFHADVNSTPYYNWLIFTSANGVNIFCQRLNSLGYHPQNLVGVRIAAIGPATASALAHYGISTDLVPGEYVAEGVVAAIIEDTRLRDESLENKRVLLPRAAEARKVLVTELQQAGAIVDEIAAYHTVSVASDDEQGHEVLRLLQSSQIDIITFTSSSTVRNFMQWLMGCVAELNRDTPDDPQHGECPPDTIAPWGVAMHLLTLNPRLKIACIGPITSQTARELGLDVHIEAQEFTIDGLVEAILQS